MTALTLRENFRALFYAPFYAAFALGAFEAEGLAVELTPPSSAAGAAAALQAGEAEVAWGGPMRALVAGDANPSAGIAVFCEVVGRDPFFLLGREPNPAFAFRDLLGRRIATVSEVPTPWMCLQHDLRLAGIDPARLDRIADRTMPENASALRSGEVDLVQVFEPFAEELVREGAGHIWYPASGRGPTSYTTFLASRAFLGREPETALRLTRAMYRTQKWLAAHTAEEIADRVALFFPNIGRETLVGALERYRASGVWNREPTLDRAGFERLRASCLSGGLIRRGPSFEETVEDRFAAQAVAEDPPSM